MKPLGRRWWPVALFGLALALWGSATVALLGLTLEPDVALALWGLLSARAGLLLLAWMLGVMLFAGVWHWIHRHHLEPLTRLAEQVQAVASTQGAAGLNESPRGPLKPLVQAIGLLVQDRERLRADIEAQVARASEAVEQERNRLATLMGELAQSVVVCNRDGRVLFYNQRARLQFRALSAVPTVPGGGDWLGIGRSIYTVLDRAMVGHAIERLLARRSRGAGQPCAQFVTTTRAGQLIKVQISLVDRVSGPSDGANGQAGASARGGEMNGFVLLLDNVTRSFEVQAQRDRALQEMTDSVRASLARLQAELESSRPAEPPGAWRARLATSIQAESQDLLPRLERCVTLAAQAAAASGSTDEIQLSDLLLAAQRRIEAALGGRVVLVPVSPDRTLQVDSFLLIQALVHLTHRLLDERQVRFVTLQAVIEADLVQIDLRWSGASLSTETALAWELDPMSAGPWPSPLSVRDVLNRHGGDLTFGRERTRDEAFFCLSLPQASEPPVSEDDAWGASDSRPEYVGFDGFSAHEGSADLDDVPLAELTYTVFDTETTGLHPSEGDQIIQIGAVRIVHGRVLRHEQFDQLVNPGRRIPESSIPIHGITDEMVRHAPDITQVLPAFHQFASDSVLVAHNAAFDMTFLQLLERRTGVTFHQPVLDTLLLSAAAQPSQTSHRLEAIAERLGVPVVGRHTALGDAMVTAEVFVRLVSVLRGQGILTLRQAREVAAQTYYARLRY